MQSTRGVGKPQKQTPPTQATLTWKATSKKTPIGIPTLPLRVWRPGRRKTSDWRRTSRSAYVLRPTVIGIYPKGFARCPAFPKAPFPPERLRMFSRPPQIAAAALDMPADSTGVYARQGRWYIVHIVDHERGERAELEGRSLASVARFPTRARGPGAARTTSTGLMSRFRRCRRITVIGRTILTVVIWVVVCPTTFAHSRSESYSNWTVDERSMTGVVTVTSNEVLSLVPLGNEQTLASLFGAHLEENVAVFASASMCDVDPAIILNAPRGFVRVELSFACAGPPTSIRYRALFDTLPEHVHFARVFSGSEQLAETVLTDRFNDVSFDAASEVGHSFVGFFDLGIRHILSGIDHIAFLLGLLLVAGQFRSRYRGPFTGFTLGPQHQFGGRGAWLRSGQ